MQLCVSVKLNTIQIYKKNLPSINQPLDSLTLKKENLSQQNMLMLYKVVYSKRLILYTETTYIQFFTVEHCIYLIKHLVAYIEQLTNLALRVCIDYRQFSIYKFCKFSNCYKHKFDLQVSTITLTLKNLLKYKYL